MLLLNGSKAHSKTFPAELWLLKSLCVVFLCNTNNVYIFSAVLFLDNTVLPDIFHGVIS